METFSLEEIEKIFNEYILKADRAKIKESISAPEYKTIDLANRKTADNLRKILVRLKKAPIIDKPKISYK